MRLDWDYSALLPLVVLVLSRPEKRSDGFCLNTLDVDFM